MAPQQKSLYSEGMWKENSWNDSKMPAHLQPILLQYSQYACGLNQSNTLQIIV